MIYPVWGLWCKSCLFSVVNFSQFIPQHNDLSVVGQYFRECSIWKLICFICSDVAFVFASCECSCCQVCWHKYGKAPIFLNYVHNYLCWKCMCAVSLGKQKKMYKYSQLTNGAWKESVELLVIAGCWGRDFPPSQLDTFKWILMCWGRKKNILIVNYLFICFNSNLTC